jgi:hypothetical protein
MMNSVDKNPSVYTGIDMSAAGFKYTGDGDTACCEYCELKVSNWTLDMDPLTIHSQRKPDCPFVRSQKVSSSLTTASEHQNPSGYVKIASSGVEFPLNTLLETNVIQQVRRRAISHWPHRTPSFSALVIEVGFFNCNVGSRVYKTRPPNCPYVKGKLIRFPISSLLIVNGNLARTTSTHLELLQSNKMVFTVAYDPTYAELPKRTWPQENLPSADDLVQVEFFYTGTRIIVTSFYCNGSSHTNNLQLLIPDESTLSTLVDARLHLPICQCLLDENFILSIIKRCWEDQVRLTGRRKNRNIY